MRMSRGRDQGGRARRPRRRWVLAALTLVVGSATMGQWASPMRAHATMTLAPAVAVLPTDTPTGTPVSPTATDTPVSPTATDTPVSPTATDTPVPPTATGTPVPPTATATRTPRATPTTTIVSVIDRPDATGHLIYTEGIPNLLPFPGLVLQRDIANMRLPQA